MNELTQLICISSAFVLAIIFAVGSVFFAVKKEKEYDLATYSLFFSILSFLSAFWQIGQAI